MSSVFSRKITISTFSGCRTGEGTPLNQRTGRRHTYRSSICRSATLSERMPPPIGVVSGPLMETRYVRHASTVSSGCTDLAGGANASTPPTPSRPRTWAPSRMRDWRGRARGWNKARVMSSAINNESGQGAGALRTSILRQLCAVRPIDPIDPAEKSRLKQVLSARALIAIGLGATIGSGIFVLTGTVAANHAGPAITLSLLIAAFGGALAALCYSEFATFLPVPGSAYSYTYATLGEALAWFIGWNLLLEYAISASAVAVSWSAYVVSLLADAHIHLPALLVNAPLGLDAHDHAVATGALINVPAVLIIAAMTALLYVGVRGSAGANTSMVALKVGIIVIIVIAGLKYIDPSNCRPYLPPNTGVRGHFGWTGVLQGAAIIFFSYVGFDTASTTALEARNPQRDLPLGIIGT